MNGAFFLFPSKFSSDSLERRTHSLARPCHNGDIDPQTSKAAQANFVSAAAFSSTSLGEN